LQTTSAEIENCFQSFGAVHDVKIIVKENTYVKTNVLFDKKVRFFRHFAFISFVNENTALDVLRQHAIVPLTFQNRPIVLAPAYKKPNISSITSRKIFEWSVYL
jgi:RNA recognition motif-containing protein